MLLFSHYLIYSIAQRHIKAQLYILNTDLHTAMWLCFQFCCDGVTVEGKARLVLPQVRVKSQEVEQNWKNGNISKNFIKEFHEGDKED